MVSANKVKMLLHLISTGSITVDDIKNEEYKTAVEQALSNQQA